MKHGLRLFALLTALLIALPAARADKVGKQIKAKVTEAMESYDLMEFEVAKNTLIDALELAEEANYQGSEVASAFLNLGIVFFSGFEDKDSAKEAFEAAVEVDGSIEVDVAYRTAEISELIDSIKARSGGGGGDAAKPDEELSCDEVEGISHDLIETAQGGRDASVEVQLGEDLDAAGALLYYRAKNSSDFKKVKLEKAGECGYKGSIPASAMKGEMIHYYIAAVDEDGEAIESKGTSGSPNIIEVASTDDYTSDNDGDIDDEIELLGEKRSVFLSVGIGGGAGYINGPTEKTGNPVQCCFAPAYLHILPELGFYLSRQFSISGAFRMGIPVTANVSGHATFAPAGYARFRYVLDESGEGIELSAAVGAGIIRNTVTIENAPEPQMDTDTTAMGPLILGGGLGYNKSLGGPMRLVIEANALSGIPAFGTDDSCMPGDGCVNPKFGVQFDFNLAMLFAF
jgi:hypothetical protein